MYRSVLPLERGARYEDCQIGGKAHNLAMLSEVGLPVPAGWLVPAEEFSAHLELSGLVASAHAVFADDAAVHCENLHRSVLGLELQPRLLHSLVDLPEVAFAVRSSAVAEDGERGSYSGLFNSVLGVAREGLADAVKAVWASVFSAEVLSYHRQLTPGGGYPAMAVLIMPLVEADFAGVAFSADPSDGNPFRIGISVCRGLGTSVVNGSEAGSRYSLDLDSLEVVTAAIGHQSEGDFLRAEGGVASETVDAEVVLSQEQLATLGAAVRRIDEVLDTRVDVEFAFVGNELLILQGRKLIGLPPFFPGDPRQSAPRCGLSHHTWIDPVAPLYRDLLSQAIEHQRVPTPPWPLECVAVACVHGRAFGHWPEEPPAIRDRAVAFRRAMEEWPEPEAHFAAYHHWTENAYSHVLPPLRRACTGLLEYSAEALAQLKLPSLVVLLKEALDLEHQTSVFYLSCSWPTSHYVELTETLLQDWFSFPSPPPRVYSTPAEQLAMELIQGEPTLTHARDVELQQVALGQGDLEAFICRWGYSYIVRDEQMYLDRWKGWREDPRPLHQAIEQMQRAENQPPLTALLTESRLRAEAAFERTLEKLGAADRARYTRRARLLSACVRFGRAHFRMKDDRDLVWSHGQAALRWVLMAAARRLVANGAIANLEDVFLLSVKELLGFLGDGAPPAVEPAALVAQRQCEQRRLARYTPALSPPAQAPAPPNKGVMIGIPTGSGLAEGKAHIVRDTSALADLATLKAGDILVFLGEGKIGLTIYFSQIAALVYSSGNGFSHEVNILRELGKPAIVSLGENAALIEEGEPLRVDAGKGTVTRLRQTGKIQND